MQRSGSETEQGVDDKGQMVCYSLRAKCEPGRGWGAVNHSKILIADWGREIEWEGGKERKRERERKCPTCWFTRESQIQRPGT